jgi:L-asparagine transporter-like permease
MDFYTVEPCTTSDAFELKFKKNIKIDMDKAADVLKKIGDILAKTAVVLVLKTNSYNASIYATGRILMKNVNKEEAEKLGKDLAGALESGGAFV